MKVGERQTYASDSPRMFSGFEHLQMWSVRRLWVWSLIYYLGLSVAPSVVAYACLCDWPGTLATQVLLE